MPLVPLPEGAELDPPQGRQVVPVPPDTPVYSGSILPFSRDAAGNTSFDTNAGILGMLKRSATLPGDVATGKVPIHAPGAPGGYNPELINRSIDLAAVMSPVNPAVRAGDRAIPGQLLAGQKPVYPPSAQELKAAASKGYDAARASGLEIRGGAVGELARTLEGDLVEKGIIGEHAPGTFAVISKIASPPEGGVATVANIESIRRAFGNVKGDNATDRFAAALAVRRLDDFLDSLPAESVVAGTAPAEGAQAVSDILRNARGNYGAAQRSNDLTGTLDRANTGILERAETRAQATYSGRNLDNTIRQRVASLLEKPKEVTGFSDAELEALREVVQGGPVRNAARKVGNFLGGGGGLGQAIVGGGTGFAASGGDPTTALLAGLAPVVAGTAAKGLENTLAKRSLAQADALTRMNSPLFRELLAQQPGPDLDRNMAILRAILMGGTASAPGRALPPAFGSLGPVI